jgi:cysteinyl-tRNA synthetase
MADWLRRALEGRGNEVLHVKNITDVGHQRQELLDRGDDKVIAAALKAGKTPRQIAEQYTESFMQDETALKILPASMFPRATEFVPHMIAMTQRLLDRGLAYEADGNVYFEVAKWPGYGRLSGNIGESLLKGVRAEADPNKRDPRDFALWKAAEHGRELKWPSPWGDGFPGWHIECSAMSTHLLGERFDIHTGGVDNIFPHHEDEIAQSGGALGHQVVQYWMHGQHLLVDGLKMAKSTGNVYTLRDLQHRGFDPIAFRYLCATVHYRHRMNFTFDSLRAATRALNRLRQEAFAAAQAPGENGSGGARWQDWFWRALDDDLHLPKALSAVWDLVRSDAPLGLKARLLQQFDVVLGFGLATPPLAIPEAVLTLRDRRSEARAAGRFTQADALRQQIHANGYEVRDASPTSTALVPVLGLPPVRDMSVESSGPALSSAEAADMEFSLVVVSRDDIDSLQRSVEALLQHAQDHSIELIAIDNASTDGTAEWLRELAARDARVRVVQSGHNIGTGAARNIGMRLARGRYVAILDTSIEFAGDVLAPLAAALEDDRAGIVGAFGVNTDNLRDFVDAPGPLVDAVEGYLMAFRRDRVSEVGLMDEKFRFYRHLDLDYSLAFRAAGYENRVVPALPLRRHAHTDWDRTPPEERDRLSKRNYYRFLKKYGHREDLLLSKSR